MTPYQLLCFISVESHLSFTRAAEDLHVAQATVSRQIETLEHEIGCRLFIRDSHGVKTTPAGDMLAQYAPAFLEQQRMIMEYVRNVALSAKRQNLRIGVGPYEYLLMRQPLRQLHTQNPELLIHFNSYTYNVLLTRYRSRVLDMVLCDELCAAHMPDYISCPIGRSRWQIAAAEDSPFWTQSSGDQQKMKNQTLITLTNDQYSDVRKYCYERFINVQMAETNFLTTQLEQIRAGIGIAILPPYIRNALAPGIIMRDILEDPYEKTCYAMVSRSLDEKIAHHMVSLIREAYICLSEMPADSH